ncbi:hypothetical protein PAPYR_13235 [Paratrimastix pyriformis]|uniref:Uncharacterized protein n=1 Tax=Paratrimastix pyriformis TaxID=342808 RepID=A0ABQ8U0J2_9EUKA|nr:hypothetical protein PAPYR_13235 [Paratrimastix pyriformis]
MIPRITMPCPGPPAAAPSRAVIGRAGTVSWTLPRPEYADGAFGAGPSPPSAASGPAPALQYPRLPGPLPAIFSGESDYERLLGQLALSAAQPAAQQKLEPRHKRPSQQKARRPYPLFFAETPMTVVELPAGNDDHPGAEQAAPGGPPAPPVPPQPRPVGPPAFFALGPVSAPPATAPAPPHRPEGPPPAFFVIAPPDPHPRCIVGPAPPAPAAPPQPRPVGPPAFFATGPTNQPCDVDEAPAPAPAPDPPRPRPVGPPTFFSTSTPLSPRVRGPREIDEVTALSLAQAPPQPRPEGPPAFFALDLPECSADTTTAHAPSPAPPAGRSVGGPLRGRGGHPQGTLRALPQDRTALPRISHKRPVRMNPKYDTNPIVQEFLPGEGQAGEGASVILERLRDALARHPDQVNTANRAGWTPLRYVVQLGATELGDDFAAQAVDMLLRAGARPEIAARHGAVTPTHKAAHAGLVQTLMTLLRHSPDLVHKRTNQGLTVLHYVAQAPTNEFPRLREVVPDLERIIDTVTQDGNTAAHYAGAYRRRETLEYLYGLGSDRNRRNANGFTPEDRFAGKGRLDVDDDADD